MKIKDNEKNLIIASLEAFLEGIDNASKPLLTYMSNASLKDMKDDDDKASYVAIMSQYQQMVGLVDTVSKVLILLKEPEKPKDESISSFGFLSDQKKAA